MLTSLTKPAARRRPLVLALRATVAALLVAGLFLVGLNAEPVFSLLTLGWQKLFLALGLAERAAALQQGVSGLVTTRSLPAVASYALLYTGACLVLLTAVLFDAARMRVVLALYAAVFGACAVLLLGGKLLGDASWAYQLGRRLIDFIVSPLPVIIFIPLLRWYVPLAPPRPS
ncbi:hypothetical protein E5K00_15880 [Hymenobacter aquaticus]|uniref:Uncharacterized protein n=1 Tax=Hymenobacter aquaticus TaxID=1867101 RepID=A0A4Z0PVJ0_9BACT|nr:hypothetical protein [Hymenobacter aquaticus]TGE21748.1 hypothetical protein E5K00_15880 [Hymenobacter aquaticus]